MRRGLCARACNETFNPIGEGFFGYPFPLPGRPASNAEFIEPGVYTVRFIYSTSSGEIANYLRTESLIAAAGHERSVSPAIQQQLDRISHVELRSNEVKITFRLKLN